MGNEPNDWRIEFYVDHRGNAVVEESINALPRADRKSIRHCLRLLQAGGVNLDRKTAKRITGHKPLIELRPHPYRLFYYARSGRRFMILHVCRKKRWKLHPKDIGKAERRMAEVEARDE